KRTDELARAYYSYPLWNTEIIYITLQFQIAPISSTKQRLFTFAFSPNDKAEIVFIQYLSFLHSALYLGNCKF
ncbi:hypothetical protein L3K78_14960, partial [Oscillospiraceae bacterium SCCA1]|nr:hypothetical protein [Oscillospiraceae bacterium SCCA1]